MKITDNSGIGTMGLTGILLVGSVIWGQLTPWWLLLGVPLVLAGIGSETAKR